MVAHRYAWTVLGNRLAWSVSRGDHKGHVCATRNGLVASVEKAVEEMEASSQWKLAVTLIRDAPTGQLSDCSAYTPCSTVEDSSTDSSPSACAGGI